MKPIVFYPGGKSKISKRILRIFPKHKIYVEVFGGSAAVLLAKRPSRIEVYNDIDENVVNLFRVLRDKEKAAELKRQLDLTPYSRDECIYAQKTLSDGDEIERARKFFVAANMGFSGKISGGFAFSKDISKTIMFNGKVSEIMAVTNRLKNVIIENKDFGFIFDAYDSPDTLFYADPPYIHESRKEKKLYQNEMDDDEHKEFIEKVINLKGKCIVSGYDSELYKTLEINGWNKIEIKIPCYLVGRTRASDLQGAGSVKQKQPRTEILWFNFSPPQKNLFT